MGMHALDRFLPTPRLVEVDSVDLALAPERAWDLLRNGDLARSPLVRALFSIRTLGKPEAIHISDLVSTPEKPGFAVLADEPPRAVVVGAIGKVWRRDIPFVHLAPDAFASFAEPDFVKVAWSIDVAPLLDDECRVTIEVRVDATDERAWKKFRRYFRVIGVGSHFIRRSLLASLAREYGTPDSKRNERPLPGDEWLHDALAQSTDVVEIAAPPEAVWPWIVQLGCQRGGFYSWDLLDNGGARSAREIHPELQRLAVGDVIPATPKGDDGFEVLAIDPERSIVLGGLFDPDAKKQLAFTSDRPKHYWHVTWSFVLEPLEGLRTRLHARARVAHPSSGNFHALWMAPVHRFMQRAELRHLAARIEGRSARDDWRDVLEGTAGAGVMLAAFFTPMLRHARSHWGLPSDVARRTYPGDGAVPEPRWAWTHGVEIDTPSEDVWPWIAQIGADRAGFYSYQWLENLAGCELRNAESLHFDWRHRAGDELRLHPKGPPMKIALASGRWLLATAPGVSWLFHVEPLGLHRCRLVSRFRCAIEGFAMGPAIMEPVGFAMDRKMLLGIKSRAEQRARTLSRAQDRPDRPRGARA